MEELIKDVHKCFAKIAMQLHNSSEASDPNAVHRYLQP